MGSRIGAKESKFENERVVLVTGALAEPSVRAMAQQLTDQFGLTVEVIVLNIQVAALMTAAWVLRKLALAPQSKPDRVILPHDLRRNN